MTRNGPVGNCGGSRSSGGCLLLDVQTPVSGRDIAAAIHLFDKVAVFVRLVFGGFNNCFCSVDGRSADAEVASNLVARAVASAFDMAGYEAVRMPCRWRASRRLQRFDGTFESHDFTWQQILADEVFVRLPSYGLKQIDHRHGNVLPSELPTRFKPPLPCDQPSVWGHDDGVEQPDLSDALDKRAQIAEIFAVTESDIDLFNVHALTPFLLDLDPPPLRLVQSERGDRQQTLCQRLSRSRDPRERAPAITIHSFAIEPYQFSFRCLDPHS